MPSGWCSVEGRARKVVLSLEERGNNNHRPSDWVCSAPTAAALFPSRSHGFSVWVEANQRRLKVSIRVTFYSQVCDLCPRVNLADHGCSLVVVQLWNLPARVLVCAYLCGFFQRGRQVGVDTASVFTAEEMAEEMSSGFNRAEKRLSLPAAFRGLRGDVPRTGEERRESITGFHQSCEDTGSRKTWRLHKVICERQVEELISEKLIQGLEPQRARSPVAVS